MAVAVPLAVVAIDTAKKVERPDRPLNDFGEHHHDGYNGKFSYRARSMNMWAPIIGRRRRPQGREQRRIEQLRPLGDREDTLHKDLRRVATMLDYHSLTTTPGAVLVLGADGVVSAGGDGAATPGIPISPNATPEDVGL